MKIFLELLKGSKQLTINHLLFVTEPFRNIMRSFFVTMIVFLLVLTPQQSLASSENIKTWNDVISNYSDTGTLGGISVPLDGDNSSDSNTMAGDEWPSLVEVYTATWCENCVTTQGIIDSLTLPEGKSMLKIHYHRFIAEVQDPFGSQTTDDRWIERYGPTSKLTNSYGYENIAPSKVFDGERIHTGTTKSSESLEFDYQNSFDKGSSLDVSEFSATLSWTNSSGNNEFSWNISTPSLNNKYIIEPMILIIEDVGYFPEGGNGEKYYHHILRDVIPLSTIDGNISIDFNDAYDGNDLTAVLIFDWNYDNSDDGIMSAVPFPSIVVFTSFFVALFYNRNDKSDLI